MKNKILLLIIAIFSFALYVGRVEADDSGCYTCLSLGEVSWGEKPSRQCPNGEWELNSDIKKEKKCVFDCSDKETCEKVNWLARCEYKQMAVDEGKTPEIVYIYFNNNIFKMFTVPENTNKLSTIGPVIKLKGLLNSYNKRKSGESGCPSFIYYRDIRSGGTHGGGLSNAYYTLDGSMVELENEKYDDKIYQLQGNKQEEKNDDRKEFNNCEQLIGEPAQKLINTFMKWIRMIVPILLIVFGIIDFATAVFSSKEDDMKKRRETFIKRIVAAVLVFLAPILVNLLLNIANDAWNWINPDTCLK